MSDRARSQELLSLWLQLLLVILFPQTVLFIPKLIMPKFV